MSALVATVVPWPKNETLPGCTPIRASASPSPSATACEGSAGVEETFQTAMRPLLSSNRQIFSECAAGIDADPPSHCCFHALPIQSLIIAGDGHGEQPGWELG